MKLPPELPADPADWPDAEHLFARLENPEIVWRYIPLLRSDRSAMVLGQDEFPPRIWHSAVQPSRAGSPQPDSDPLYKDVGQEEEQYPNVHSYELEGLAHPADPYVEAAGDIGSPPLMPPGPGARFCCHSPTG